LSPLSSGDNIIIIREIELAFLSRHFLHCFSQCEHRVISTLFLFFRASIASDPIETSLPASKRIAQKPALNINLRLFVPEMISKFAHSIIHDGDDIHITDSFQPNEENSSTVGNASAIEPTSLATKMSTKVSTKVSTQVSSKKFLMEAKQKTLLGPKSDYAPRQHDDEDSAGEQVVLEATNRFNVLSVIRQLGETRRFLPWRLRHPPITFLPRSTILSSVTEYQVMVEDDAGDNATQAASDTAASLRSSRNNLRNGKSLLVRQNAEVFGRPSAAQVNWEIASSLSSSDSSNNTRNLTGQRSVTLEGSSCGGISDITEETALFRIKKMDRSMNNRFPMFIGSKSAQLGDTFCIHEVEDETFGEDLICPVSDVLERSYDFRQLKTPPDRTQTSHDNSDSISLLEKAREVDNQLLLQTSEWHNPDRLLDLFASASLREEQTHESDDEVRQRIYSDSDVIFERQRQRSSKVDHQLNFPLDSSCWFSETSNEDFHIKSKGDTREPLNTYETRRSLDTGFDKILASRLSPPSMEHMTRSRTQSDSFLEQVNAEEAFWGDLITCSQIERECDESSQMFPQIERPIGPLQRDSSTGATVESNNENRGSSWTSNARRLSEVLMLRQTTLANVSNSGVKLGSSDPLFSGNGSKWNHSRHAEDPDENDPNQLQAHPRSSIPGTTNTGQKITAKMHLETVSSGTSCYTDYYWTQDSESHSETPEAEVLWSLTSDSLDDII
jgi:hypothetical protein